VRVPKLLVGCEYLISGAAIAALFLFPFCCSKLEQPTTASQTIQRLNKTTAPTTIAAAANNQTRTASSRFDQSLLIATPLPQL
jgi:hypothetical protein